MSVSLTDIDAELAALGEVHPQMTQVLEYYGTRQLALEEADRLLDDLQKSVPGRSGRRVQPAVGLHGTSEQLAHAQVPTRTVPAEPPLAMDGPSPRSTDARESRSMDARVEPSAHLMEPRRAPPLEPRVSTPATSHRPRPPRERLESDMVARGSFDYEALQRSTQQVVEETGTAIVQPRIRATLDTQPESRSDGVPVNVRFGVEELWAGGQAGGGMYHLTDTVPGVGGPAGAGLTLLEPDEPGDSPGTGEQARAVGTGEQARAVGTGEQQERAVLRGPVQQRAAYLEDEREWVAPGRFEAGSYRSPSYVSRPERSFVPAPPQPQPQPASAPSTGPALVRPRRRTGQVMRGGAEQLLESQPPQRHSLAPTPPSTPQPVLQQGDDAFGAGDLEDEDMAPLLVPPRLPSSLHGAVAAARMHVISRPSLPPPPPAPKSRPGDAD